MALSVCVSADPKSVSAETVVSGAFANGFQKDSFLFPSKKILYSHTGSLFMYQEPMYSTLQVCVSTISLHRNVFMQWRMATRHVVTMLNVISKNTKNQTQAKVTLTMIAEQFDLLYGLRVDAGKTKVMQCRVSRFQSEDSGEHPCGVCRKGVGNNAVLCVECLSLVHKRCSGISGKLKSDVDFHCRRCLEGGNGLFQSVLLKEVVIEPNVKLECVPKFCWSGRNG